MEILDIVDEQGVPTGETVERVKAHSEGIRHRTSHVWILRKEQGELEILLQKRSDEKDSYPGCYDISSAGHIPSGVDFIPSALRELKEELGLVARPDELHYCGQRHFQFEQTFHGRPFLDNQVSNVYALWCEKNENEFALQKEEVSEVRWFKFKECVNAVRENKIPHCIFLEELNMIANYIDKASQE